MAAGVAKECAALAKTFRGPGAYARGDQLVRAALSIVSNIAEACGRGTVPDFRRFLLHARASAQEILAPARSHHSGTAQSPLDRICLNWHIES